ncbi:MAG: type VI secretion system lipoprotein TssJ [Pseudomonadota bacterium]
MTSTAFSATRAARSLRSGLAFCMAVSILSGCSSTPEPVEPTLVRIELSAADSLNPDMNGRPSPVVVRLFRLRQSVVFDAMDYFSLTDREQETLGDELLFRESLVLHPGESTVREYSMEEDGRLLGIIASYRDIDASTWRTSVALPVPSEPWFELPDFLKWDDPTLKYSARLETRAISLVPHAEQ